MDAPEKIWTYPWAGGLRAQQYGGSEGCTEYVRADIHARLAAEDERLRKERDGAEKAIRAIAFLRPLGPTRNKLVEQMERIAVNALDALSSSRAALTGGSDGE